MQIFKSVSTSTEGWLWVLLQGHVQRSIRVRDAPRSLSLVVSRPICVSGRCLCPCSSCGRSSHSPCRANGLCHAREEIQSQDDVVASPLQR